MARIITNHGPARGRRVYRVEESWTGSPTHARDSEGARVFLNAIVGRADRPRPHVDRQYLHKILRGEPPVTRDMAINSGKLAGYDPGLAPHAADLRGKDWATGVGPVLGAIQPAICSPTSVSIALRSVSPAALCVRSAIIVIATAIARRPPFTDHATSGRRVMSKRTT